MSRRLARVVSAFTAGNPLEKVLKMIDNTISILEEEEAEDVKKKGTCENETSTNEAAKLDKETALGDLDGTIAQLLVSIKDTETSISETQDSLKVNRESQAEDTAPVSATSCTVPGRPMAWVVLLCSRNLA